MDGLQVRQVSLIPGLKEGYIFNSPEFQYLKGGNKKYFILYDNDQALARICFHIVNGKATSGHQATFGSIDCSDILTKEDASFFIEEVVRELRKEEIKEILIRHWPDCYVENKNIHDLLISLGFVVSSKEINQHIIVNDDDFKRRIKNNERKKLNQSLNNGYTFKILSIEELEVVYHLVKLTRDRKGYPVSMTYNDLMRTIKAISNNYILFGVLDNDKLIAAAVSLLISPKIMYNFYHADDVNYRSTSPMVMLLHGIYEYCQQQGIALLDLGISSENGVVNKGLFKFKQNLGCDTSDKNTYHLCYDQD